MTKLSKRKRQGKEIGRRQDDDFIYTDEIEDKHSDNNVNNNNNSSNKQSKVSKSKGKKSVSDYANKNEDDRIWVQCNECDKWRALPSYVKPDSLPDIWTCKLNIYDNTRNSCDAPEEDYKNEEEEKDTQVKGFFKLWVKRLRNADRAENRLPSSAFTRGKKRKYEIEWLRCSNPSCGKWRAVARNIEVGPYLQRLNKGKHFGGEKLWYCSMNTWDDTTASCSAPQEPLWNCKWNLSTS